MKLSATLISLLVFFSAAAAASLLLFVVWGRDRRMATRLGQLSGGKDAERNVGRIAAKLHLRAQPRQVVKSGDNSPFQDSGEQSSTPYKRLIYAGVYSPWALVGITVARTVLTCAPPVLAVLIACMGNFRITLALFWGGVAGGFGFIAPSLWLDYRKARRHATFNRSLPDALDLLVTCVEGGMSLEAGLQRMTDELQIAHPVLAGEMGAVQKQIEFGTSPDAALRNFAERTDLDSLYVLSTLLQQARRFGTPIAETLRTHAETMRSDRELLAEELAQKAAVKILFPTLLLIFPAIFVILAGPAAIQLSEAFGKK